MSGRTLRYILVGALALAIGIPSVAVGFGEEQLKSKDNPLAGENRRVQVVNMASADVAAKAAAPDKPE